MAGQTAGGCVMWTIYSIGDSAFLERVLIGVAMVVGTGDFTSVVRIGLLVGLILVMFQSLSQGAERIPFSQVVIAWIVYSGIYGPGATAIIEDAYTGQVRVVDNVPFGVAVGGSLVSNIGYGLTSTFETAFSTPSLTHDGFGGGMDVLRRVRTFTASRAKYLKANDPTGNKQADFYQSWVNYMTNCTTVMLKINENESDLLGSTDFINAVKYDTKIDGTKLSIGNGWQGFNCQEGHMRLVEFSRSTFYPALLKNVLARILHAKDGNTAEHMVQEALDRLRITDATARDFILTSILEPIYRDAWATAHQNDLAYGYAAMVDDAVKQRAVAAAGEYTFFGQMERPVLAFFEGLVFAITPFIAFLIVMGSVGFRAAGFYLVVLWWLQLWTPILSIINLYIVMSGTGEMAALSGTMTGSITSVAGLLDGDSIAERWLTTGEKMAALTPIIALAIATGSAFTLTSLTGRISGAGSEHLNPKKAAPDTFSPQPIFATTSQWKEAPNEGITRTGASDVLPSFGYSSGASTRAASDHAEARQTSAAFLQSLGQRVSHTSSSGMRAGSSDNFTTHNGTELSQFTQANDAIARSIVEKHAHGQSVNTTQAARMVADAGASIAFGKAPAQGSIAAGLSSQFGINKDVAQRMESDVRQAYDHSSGNVVRLAESGAQDIRKGKEQWSSSETSASSDKDLRQQASEVLSRTDSFRRAQEVSRAATAGVTYKSPVLAERLAEDRATRDYLWEQVARHGLGGAVDKEMRSDSGLWLTNQFAGDANKAADIVAMKALKGMLPGAQMDGLRAELAAESADNVVYRAFGASFGGFGSASANEGIGAGAPGAGVIPSMVRPAVGEAQGLPAGAAVEQGARGGLTAYDTTQGAGGKAAVAAMHQQFTGRATTQANGWEKDALERDGRAFERGTQQLKEQGQSAGGYVQAGANLLAGEVRDAWNLVSGIGQGYGESYRQSWMSEYEKARKGGLTEIQASAFAEERMAASFGRQFRELVAPVVGQDPRDAHRDNLGLAVT